MLAALFVDFRGLKNSIVENIPPQDKGPAGDRAARIPVVDPAKLEVGVDPPHGAFEQFSPRCLLLAADAAKLMQEVAATLEANDPNKKTLTDLAAQLTR